MNALFALALLQDNTTTTTTGVSTGAAAGMGIGMLLVVCALILFYLIATWKIFVKAGKPGWASIVPLYNIIVLIQICCKPLWWIIISPFLVFPLATRFGKGTGFALGLFFLSPIFWPILAFGNSKYTPC